MPETDIKLPWPENEFWDFSIALYQKPNVAKACLELQDKTKANVNILLYCCWIADRYGAGLTAQAFQHLERATHPWSHNVIHPLRQARKAVRTCSPSLSIPPGEEMLIRGIKQEILRVELLAERYQQQKLYDLTPSLLDTLGIAPDPRLADLRTVARQNIAAYEHFLKNLTPTSRFSPRAVTEICDALELPSAPPTCSADS
ncbi:TIGR02444 family protein [Luteithermobacter gelatinilyticus]|uniref:TIGR02444 family protein n=1 Tax=Luteithermobacter gelatinilyticus TaxID=2582913 RepID=UPI00110744A2|nr:TIGR02444 family protein [Luteithermobacter gelatinilyticus]